MYTPAFKDFDPRLRQQITQAKQQLEQPTTQQLHGEQHVQPLGYGQPPNHLQQQQQSPPYAGYWQIPGQSLQQQQQQQFMPIASRPPPTQQAPPSPLKPTPPPTYVKACYLAEVEKVWSQKIKVKGVRFLPAQQNLPYGQLTGLKTKFDKLVTLPAGTKESPQVGNVVALLQGEVQLGYSASADYFKLVYYKFHAADIYA